VLGGELKRLGVVQLVERLIGDEMICNVSRSSQSELSNISVYH